MKHSVRKACRRDGRRRVPAFAATLSSPERCKALWGVTESNVED